MPPKAKKDTRVLIINLGITSHGTESNPTLVEKAKQVAKRIIEKRIFVRPKDEVGIILMGSAVSNNSLNIDHIGQLTDIEIANWNFIEKIMELKATTYHSNWIEAIYVALDYIKTNVIHEKNSSTKLFLLSDFNEESDVISQFEADEIANEISAEHVQLYAIGDESLDDKPEESLKPSEVLLKEVLKRVEGHYGTFDSVLSDLRFFNEMPTKSAPWQSDLELADRKLPICSYIKISDADKLPPWKYAKDGEIVKPVREYMDRQRQTYNEDEIVRGYKYGDKFIPVDKHLQETMDYKSGEKSYKIHSFTHKDNVDLEYWCSGSTRVVVPANEHAAKPFYSLVQAMVDQELVAIVRKVYNTNSLPKMVALFPSIDVPEEPWCLVEVELPFAEDRRVIESRPIKSMAKRLTSEQNEAVDNLLDSLLISDAESNYEDGPQSFLPGYVQNPMTQHVWNTLSFRAVNPKTPLPPMEDHLKNIFELPSVQSKCEPHLEKIATLFQLESIEPTRKRKADFALKNVPSDTQDNDNSNGAQSSRTENKPEIDQESESFMDPVLSLDTSDIDIDDLVANI